jgi:hypothetical protein
MRVTIVESPYNHPQLPPLECIRYALWCCADADARGECCFASHLFFTQFIPETKEGRNRGLSYRDELVRRLQCKVARYTDLGTTAGMFREVDSVKETEERQLSGEIRTLWSQGYWPEGSLKCRI